MCYTLNMKYFFVLGRNPTLSVAEIASFMGKIDPNFLALDASSEALVIETEKGLIQQDILKKLGGTIKVGEILKETDELKKEDFVSILEEKASENKGKKLFFGFSLHSLGKNREKISKEKQGIDTFAIQAKKFLKEKKISSRWVTSKEEVLSSVVVSKNKLLEENGIEVVVLAKEDKVLLGKTLAVQEFEELGKRDFGRPKRDMQVGLIPPKLAQIMINLAGVEKDGLILDPFCGFGTILSEASLFQYTDLIGSDVSEENLQGAQENLKWLHNNYEFRDTSCEFIKCDARHISEKLDKNSISAVITEPYLGPALQGNETKEKILEIIKELSILYVDTFREFKSILKKNGKVVILFPVFSSKNEETFLPIREEIKKIGFVTENILPKELVNKDFIKITPRNSIIYSRPGQKVLREVLVFKLV